MVYVITDNSDISYTNSYWINNVMISQNENKNDEKLNEEYEIYIQELESLTKDEEKQKREEKQKHGEKFREKYEGSTYIKSFVKPKYSKTYTNSRRDKILAQDRGTSIIFKSWSRTNF